ncbi:hypothetical protein [Sulfuriroseicoccus oceanibius]|nr:hypothetical protein [Sulfuriroseicoccus oceanibius]
MNGAKLGCVVVSGAACGWALRFGGIERLAGWGAELPGVALA